LLIALEKLTPNGEGAQHIQVYIAAQGDSARIKSFEVLNMLRASGIESNCDLNERSMKAQMREANRERASYVYILGEAEIAMGAGMLKNMQTGEQESIAFDRIVTSINEKRAASAPVS
jgi:histidyl-tRNA synthetase